jgi:GxxExxY protein
MNADILERDLVHSIVGAFFEVYNHLGFGLLERLYSAALEYELELRGHEVAREVSVPVSYKGRHLGWQRIDMLVDRRVIVENKSTEVLPPFARRQLVNYLCSSRYQVGLLLHFGPRPRFYRFVDTRKN